MVILQARTDFGFTELSAYRAASPAGPRAMLCLGTAVLAGPVLAEQPPSLNQRPAPLAIFAPLESSDGRTWSKIEGDTQPQLDIVSTPIALRADGNYQKRGPMRPVVGVTCDNGLAVPLDKWNYVVISLPLDFDPKSSPQITLTATPPCEPEDAARTKPVRDAAAVEKLGKAVDAVIAETNPQAKLLWGSDVQRAAADLTGTLGTVAYRPEQREIWYFPPLEFNDGAELYRSSGGKAALTSRAVDLTIRGKQLGNRDFIAHSTIKLKRPQVVMVHGINNGPRAWEGLQGVGVAKDLRRAGFETWAVNYGEDDLKLAKPRKRGAKYFRGNAPVEYAAAQLNNMVGEALAERQAEGFTGSRVDVLGHSYGGIVARWFTTMQVGSKTEERPDTFAWYVNSSNNHAVPDIYSIDWCLYNGLKPQSPYHHVRKLITIASPWRGTPIANIVNEVHGPAPIPAPKGFATLGEARMGRGKRRPLKLSRFIGDVLDLGGVPDRVPSLEVAAIESRWLRALNQRPFRDDIAYEAIAGNKNAYILKRIDLFSTLCESLPEGVLPVLQQERIARRRNNLSDGLIPVWSAVIDKESPVFYAAHNSIMWNKTAKNFLISALDNANLKGGQPLNKQWATDWDFVLKLPTERKGLFPEKLQKWSFSPGRMAPTQIGDAYQLLTSTGVAGGVGNDDAVARIGAYYLEHDVVTTLPQN